MLLIELEVVADGFLQRTLADRREFREEGSADAGSAGRGMIRRRESSSSRNSTITPPEKIGGRKLQMKFSAPRTGSRSSKLTLRSGSSIVRSVRLGIRLLGMQERSRGDVPDTKSTFGADCGRERVAGSTSGVRRSLAVACLYADEPFRAHARIGGRRPTRWRPPASSAGSALGSRRRRRAESTCRGERHSVQPDALGFPEQP
jgi:hypothetical protein